MGMGNAFAAIADDGDAFYYNPAGLTTTKKFRLDVEPVRFIPTRDFYDELKDLEELLNDIDALNESSDPLEDPGLEDERRRLTQRMERLLDDRLGLDAGSPVRFVVPLHIGDYGLAIGGIWHAWSASRAYVRRRGLDWANSTMDLMDDEIIYDVMAEMSYGGSAAIEIPSSVLPLELSLGVGARRIHRWQMTDKDDPLGIVDVINPDGKDGIEGTADDFKERFFDPDDPLDSVAEATGYSVDFGTIASFEDMASFGFALQNLIGEIGDEDLSRNVEISVAANLAKIAIPDIPALDVIVAGSLNRANETWGSGNILDRARFGVEVIWNMSTLSVSGRAGSNRGYMTLGAGIQLAFLDFDYAYYADVGPDWHGFSLNLTF